jgi:small conductance mechanosensitive channel
LAEDHVKIIVRAWVKTEDFWPVYFEMNKRVYQEFEANGVKLPE